MAWSTQKRSLANSPDAQLVVREPLTKRMRRDTTLYIMLAPAVIVMIIFKFWPIAGIVMAFQDFSVTRGFFRSRWVGLEHFVDFFSSPVAWRIIRNTLILSVYQIIFVFPAPIILASLFNELRWEYFKRFAQSVSYLPHFISVVVISGMIINFLSPSQGIVNNIFINVLGLIEKPIYFLGKPEYFRSIYVLSDIWQQVGWGTILYMAVLSRVDVQLYDAAVIDGANRWQRYWHVTFVTLIPVTVVMFILRIARVLDSAYEKIILLYNPLTYETADVIDSYVFRQGLEMARYSYAAAVGVFKAIIGLILVVLANRLSKKLSKTSLW